jgi:hypothetical protein
MPAVSQSQQRLMGMAWAYQKGDLSLKGLPASLKEKIKELAGHMKKKDLSDFAHTTHEGLPERITCIVNEILKIAQNKKLIFSYGAFSPDGDSRYYDFIHAYINTTNNEISIIHTGSGAAGGMDSFTPGIETQKSIETFKLPQDSNRIINWIKRSLHQFPFLKYVKLKDIKWEKADGSEIRGLSQGILSDVLNSYSIIVEKPMSYIQWVRKNYDILSSDWKNQKKEYQKPMFKRRNIKPPSFEDFTKRVYRNTNNGENYTKFRNPISKIVCEIIKGI